jgi:hypothetical protein
MLLAALVLVIGTMMLQALAASGVRADTRAAIVEARKLNEAFRAYYHRHGVYPNSYAEPRLALKTLEPLRKRGYYRGHVTAILLLGRVDAYDSPDDRGPNQEFWVEMTLKRDPSIRLLVVRSDDAPLGGGRWLDGVYLYRNRELRPV